MATHVQHSVLFAGLMPHAPIIVPDVAQGHGGEVRRTIQAMESISRKVVESRADTLVLISPHSPRKRGAFGIWRSEDLRGSFAAFGAPSVTVRLPLDVEFANALADECSDRAIRTWDIAGQELDHGALVPLYFIQHAGWKKPAVVIGLNYPDEGQLTELGEAIAAAAGKLNQTVAVIASGDMSHRLAPSAPGGFHPRAHEFDKLFVQLVEEGRYDEICQFNDELQSLAGEDVVDSSVVAIAASGFERANHELLNYEGPFGVGYSVAVFCDRRVTEQENRVSNRNGELGALPKIARQAVELWVTKQRKLEWEGKPTGRLASRAAVFVTIRTRDGELRGCIGNLHPEQPNVVEETIDRAIVTATSDLRFEPITVSELPELTYEVSVLHDPELVLSQEELDPEKYGVIVTDRRGRRAVMLPGIETLDTIEKQLSATKRKAGIPANEEVTIERFKVEKLEE